MNTLPVSKKVYSDITSRVNTTLSFAPTSAAEAMRLVDSYLAGFEAESSDPAATIAFSMIRPELDRAMSRSARARERARIRKAKLTASADDSCPVAPPAANNPEVSDGETDTVPVMISRRQRRAMERARLKRQGKKWKRIA